MTFDAGLLPPHSLTPSTARALQEDFKVENNDFNGREDLMSSMAAPTLVFISADLTINAGTAAFNCYPTAHSILILWEYYTLQYSLLSYFYCGVKLMNPQPRI